jgi:hypothetical protein
LKFLKKVTFSPMKASSVKHLANFLNHGFLPFVGRDAELERLFAFWKGTIDSYELRASLLVGEAGIGKSRLIEELMSRIIAAGGAVIHAKLYPESATTITPLLAWSLWHSIAGRELLKKEPEPNRESLLEALRRIAGLRPTIIIIEDIHLLSSDGVRECATLLESLADETISFLAASRPVMNTSRSILERYLVDEIQLHGLDGVAFAALCSDLFDDTIDHRAIALLEKATKGNSLALRSALRGALKSGYLDRKNDRGQWQLSVTESAFSHHLESNVRMLSEGMAAHLDPEEMLACERLALLGELFSLEAAEAMLPQASAMLERLRFKGMIVAGSSAQRPLSDEPTAYPLFVFSHSLLHNFFFTLSTIGSAELIDLVIKDLPFYAIAPFMKLAKLEIDTNIPLAKIGDAIRKSDSIARNLDSGSDWELALVLWNAGNQVFRKYQSLLAHEVRKDLDIFLTKTHLRLLRRQLQSQEYYDALNHLFELTANPVNDSEAEEYLAAFVFQHWYLDRQPRAKANDGYNKLQQDVKQLLDAFPSLRCCYTIAVYLSYEAKRAANDMSFDLMREVEEAAAFFLSSPNCTDRLRAIMRGHVLPHFLVIFSSREELDRRLELAKEIQAEGMYDNIMFPVRRIEMLTAIGKLKEAEAELAIHTPRFVAEGLVYTVFLMRLDMMSIKAALGESFDSIIDESRSIFPAIPPETHDQGKQAVIRYLFPVAVMLGDIERAKLLLTEFGQDHQQPLAFYYVLFALLNNEDPKPHLVSLPQSSRLHTLFQAYEQNKQDEVVAEATSFLAQEVVQQADILNALIVIEFLVSLELATHATEKIGKMVNAILQWLAEGEITGYLSFIYTRYTSFLSSSEAKSWKQKIEKPAKQKAPAPVREHSSQTLLSMLGAIEITTDSIPKKVRGARLRSVLGMMTANLMLDEPLSPREFRLLAAGEKEDAELARKTVNMAIAALKDDLGPDTIVTTGDTPSFDLTRIRIDLLEASDLLDDAAKAVRRGSLVKAVPDLHTILDLALGKVAFPTLYDNLFEAIRDDLDARIRKVTLEVAKRLVSERDLHTAIGILKKYYTAIPDDNEISALLKYSLEETGQKTEAERINIKAALSEN